MRAEKALDITNRNDPVNYELDRALGYVRSEAIKGGRTTLYNEYRNYLDEGQFEDLVLRLEGLGYEVIRICTKFVSIRW